ncbi:DUF418 domain-containing protein [Nocardiopsis sp. EMB25]|uniref:DUF418 domain-containing protein n=1 Tax=Nocardiopsis sp. EMB25 TaxID=2835867 RepID=UPI00228418A4|nr:DUF418 domain-containing protein [Nocardiopsis sp. EMB25]MCY9786493.1 DUF418 domain-containing protein [Nocardiopsis sp. EMB25]
MSTRAADGPSTRPEPGRRILDLDALRGFALLGILVVNIGFFASGYAFHQVHDPAFTSPLDRGTHWLVAMFFEMKFYLLFSFLFGYGFTLQFDSARRRGVGFTGRFLRRLVGLFAIGALHAVLLFQGDILTTYAVLGLVLLALHRARARTAVIAAAVLVGLVAVMMRWAGMSGAAPFDEETALAAGEATTAALAGGPLTVIGEHLESLPRMLVTLVGVQGPVALAAFLVGLAVGRHRVLADAGAHDHTLRLIQWVGFPVGLVGSLVLADLGGTADLYALSLALLTAPFLSAAYAATLLRLFQRGRGRRIAAALAPAGRMALSNYLGQSLVCALLFTGFGLGLVGRVAPPFVLLIAVVLFAVQLWLSAWWMARHRYGPAEWFLRAVTNLEVPDWRRREGRPDRADADLSGAPR